MTPQEVMDKIREFEGDGIVTLSPGPIRLKVCEFDKQAFEILDWFKINTDYTIKDCLKVLDAARWWLIYWAAWANEIDKP